MYLHSKKCKSTSLTINTKRKEKKEWPEAMSHLRLRLAVLSDRIGGEVAGALLDALDDLELGAGGEREALEAQQPLQVRGDGAAGHVAARERVREREALADGHGVRHAVARVQHGAGGAARRVEAEHGLHGEVEGGRAQRLEEHLGRLLTVLPRVQRRLRQQHRMLATKKVGFSLKL